MLRLFLLGKIYLNSIVFGNLADKALLMKSCCIAGLEQAAGWLKRLLRMEAAFFASLVNYLIIRCLLIHFIAAYIWCIFLDYIKPLPNCTIIDFFVETLLKVYIMLEYVWDLVYNFLKTVFGCLMFYNRVT